MTENGKSALEMARERRREMAEAGIKVVVKNPLEKLAERPESLRLAINAKCYQCEGGDSDPGVKQRIGTCSIRDCGLWAVRPYQGRVISGDVDSQELSETANGK